jgi:N-acetyl-anhydromuramyl-L-alanine amidase AmpD
MKIIESNLGFQKIKNRNVTTGIVLHHAAHKSCTVEDVHRWHKNNGWSGIGYHFFITKDGNIYRGRPENSVGAHCYKHNFYTLGICVQGNFMEDSMSKEQKDAVIKLCKYLCEKYKIQSIKAHRELGATSCPGINYPLEDIRKEVLKRPIAYDTYTVKKGDTLWSISRKFHMKLDELRNLNNLGSDIIYPNQILRIL